MSNPSNLYAEKIYSEHPLVLWALDDQLDYISLITENQRNINSGWSITNGTTSSGSSISNEPFSDSATTVLTGNLSVNPTMDITAISPTIININTLNDSLETFSIGTYFYSNSIYLRNVSIGYEYTDPSTMTVVQNLKTFSTIFNNKWSYISETFEVPNVNANLRIVLVVGIIEGASNTSENQFYFNGLSLGQWSEEFQVNSLGLNTTTVPADVSQYGGLDAIEAQAYGIAEDSGYYIAESKLYARNSGVPLVYGASGVTTLSPYSSASLIIPGKGFLNQKGQHNDYTVEFWARINSSISTPFRIFGPIASEDGLYVEGGFLTLVIGDQFASHFVGEWYRPMLIHIRLIRNSASLLINGEQVLSLTIDTSNLALPTELSEESGDIGNNQDWLGFYSSADISPFEVDCVAIYSYQVPVTLAKRRWVYGQGVISPEGINSAYGGITAFIDYPFSNYAVNYNYPDFAQWQQGTFDNLLTTATTLRTPEYSLPEIFTGSKTLEELYSDNQDLQTIDSGPFLDNKFIRLRPNSGWNSINSYINFSRLNILADQMHTVYGVFSIINNTEDNTILFKVVNSLSGNYFEVKTLDADIVYTLFYNGVEEEIYVEEDGIPDAALFAAGFQIHSLVNTYGGNLAAFFGNQNGLNLYVGGDGTSNVFSGRIYSVGLSTAINASYIANHFADNGVAISSFGQELLDHTASYTLLPTESYNKYFLDIGVASYWQDYLPLSYFAKYVTDESGNKHYDLDFLQFNIGYPSPTELTEDSNGDYFYDTTNSEIKSYATFQYVVDGANSVEEYADVIKPNQYNLIDLNDHTDWETTKFEILNNTIIYPKQNIDFNSLAIVYNLEIKSRGILTKPILLNKLQFASQVLNSNSSNPVGTRFGVDLFPYKKSGIYYDYKTKNPFSIYKESTPYLYLTKNSGIEIRGEQNNLINRGISFPINSQLASNYKVSAAQLWFRYDKDFFPADPVELFEINHKQGTVKVYIVANSDSGNRGRIFALNASGTPYEGIAFYLNGSIVREPIANIKEWSVIGISFAVSLLFDSYLGNINLTGPAVFNNIAYYQANSISEVQSSAQRPWLKVLTDTVTTFQWQFWLNSYTWDGVLNLGQTDFYFVNPSDIYKTYTGTNKIIVDDTQGISYNPELIKIYTETEWSTSISTPV